MFLHNASVNSTCCAQPPLPRATAGHLPALSVPGLGHLQMLHCPGAGHLPSPGPFPSFWRVRDFLSEYNYTEGFTGKKAEWLICQGQEKIVEGCKGMFSILYVCMHFFIAYQARITEQNWSYRCESTFFGCWITLLLILFEEHPFIFINLFITYNFTALY